MDHAPTDAPGPDDAHPSLPGDLPSASDTDRGDTPVPVSTAGADQPPAWRRGTLGCVVEIAQTLVLTLLLFFGIQAFVAQPFQVKQHSMERTFVENDYVLVDRLTPNFSPYARGQVIVFRPPEDVTDRTDPFIKRVIGVAGDTVEVRDGAVWINGAKLDEPYLYRDETGAIEPTDAVDEATWTIQPGQLFVMGDHRQLSDDSREFGPIEVSSVIGRGVMRYWPLSSFWIIVTPTYDNVPAP